METIFDWAVARNHRRDNPAGKHILRVLPSTKRQRQHHRALPYGEVLAVLWQVGHSTCYPLSKLASRLLF